MHIKMMINSAKLSISIFLFIITICNNCYSQITIWDGKIACPTDELTQVVKLNSYLIFGSFHQCSVQEEREYIRSSVLRMPNTCVDIKLGVPEGKATYIDIYFLNGISSVGRYDDIVDLFQVEDNKILQLESNQSYSNFVSFEVTDWNANTVFKAVAPYSHCDLAKFMVHVHQNKFNRGFFAPRVLDLKYMTEGYSTPIDFFNGFSTFSNKEYGSYYFTQFNDANNLGKDIGATVIIPKINTDISLKLYQENSIVRNRENGKINFDNLIRQGHMWNEYTTLMVTNNQNKRDCYLDINFRNGFAEGPFRLYYENNEYIETGVFRGGLLRRDGKISGINIVKCLLLDKLKDEMSSEVIFALNNAIEYIIDKDKTEENFISELTKYKVMNIIKNRLSEEQETEALQIVESIELIDCLLSGFE